MFIDEIALNVGISVLQLFAINHPWDPKRKRYPHTLPGQNDGKIADGDPVLYRGYLSIVERCNDIKWRRY